MFDTKVNTETVDVDPVVLEEDIKLLGDLLQEFKDKTGSEVAAMMLQEWPASASKFVKVCDEMCYNATGRSWPNHQLLKTEGVII